MKAVIVMHCDRETKSLYKVYILYTRYCYTNITTIYTHRFCEQDATVLTNLSTVMITDKNYKTISTIRRTLHLFPHPPSKKKSSISVLLFLGKYFVTVLIMVDFLF